MILDISMLKKVENISENELQNKLKEIINENIFYAGLKEDNSQYLLEKLIEGINIDLNDKEKDLLKKAKYKPKNIKIISELLHQGKSIEFILNMKELEINYTELIKNRSSYPLYILLLNMPSGLPDLFLQKLFNDYDKIIDDMNLIIKSPDNNWNIIDNNIKFNENWNEPENILSCYEYLFETLKIYTKLLNYFIEKNREKINNKLGNVHYIFNSYNNRTIWKCNIPNKLNIIIKKDILKKDLNIENHKKNIINLISLIIKYITLFRQQKIIIEEIDDYLEDTLILFPSYFFLKKDNKKLIQLCIYFCEQLIKVTEDDNLLHRENCIKYKLFLFLYSIDENIDEDKKKFLKCSNIEDELKFEFNFLEEIRKKDINVDNLINLEQKTQSKEMKLYLKREIANNFFKNKNYDKCLNYLNNIIKSNNFNDIQKYRAIIDYCYVSRKKIIFNNNEIITVLILLEEQKSGTYKF